MADKLKEIGVKFTLFENCTDRLTKIAQAFGQTEQAAKRTTKNFNSAVKQMGKHVNEMNNNIAGLAKAGAIFGVSAGAIVSFGKNCANAASDLQETIGKVNETFKGNSSDIEEWAKTSIDKMGLSRQSAMDTAALFGDMASGFGISTKKSAEMSMTLTQLSADLASFKNMSQERAKLALNGVFTGETQALKGLGVVMNQAELQNFAYSKGIRKKINDMKESEKVLLRYQFVLSRTTNAQGDFLRTGKGYANQTRMFAEIQQELATQMGEAFLPQLATSLSNINKIMKDEMPNIVKSVTPIFQSFAKTIEFCTQHLNDIITTIKIAGGVFIAFKTVMAVSSAIVVVSDAVGILNGVLEMMAIRTKVVTAATTLWTNAVFIATHAQELFALAMAANPVGMMITGISLAVSGLIALAMNWDKVTNAVKVATSAVKDFFHIKSNQNPVTTTADIPKYAGGTDFAHGGLSLVGERGPELVNLPRGSQVLNNSDTQKALNKNITINLNFGGSVISEGELINKISNVLGRQLQTALQC